MTPETEQAPPGPLRRPRASPGGTIPVPLPPRDVPSIVRDAGTPVRSGESVRSWPREAEAARTGQRDPAAWPPPSFPPPAAAKRAREDESIVRILPYLAILTCTIAGVYVAWHQGSAGAGRGGVVSGAALLVAAFLRLVLPARLVGLLGTRKRVIDVLTLTVFGGGLLVAGLILPR